MNNKSAAADQKALAAGQTADQANQNATQASNRVTSLAGTVENLDNNVDSRSEFNFHSDPDAADYVLQSASVPKVLVPLDVTHQVLLTAADLAEIGDSRSGRLVKSIVGRYQRGYAGSGLAGSPLHDPLAMGFCIDPTFLELQPTYLRVETTGTYTRGPASRRTGRGCTRGPTSRSPSAWIRSGSSSTSRRRHRDRSPGRRTGHRGRRGLNP